MTDDSRKGIVLTLAVLGIAAYGIYSIVAGVLDLVAAHQLEIIVDVALVALGLLLILAAAFVRVLIPGGLALAIAGMLGLQALAVHNTLHFYGRLVLFPQVVRGAVAIGLVVLAWLGARAIALNRP